MQITCWYFCSFTDFNRLTFVISGCAVNVLLLIVCPLSILLSWNLIFIYQDKYRLEWFSWRYGLQITFLFLQPLKYASTPLLGKTIIVKIMKGLYSIGLLLCSNIFMTLAWYSHLKLQSASWFSKLSLPLVILFSWGIALFEYCCQVPANRIGFVENGGPFNLWQLKVIQEAVSLTVFTVFMLIFFKNEPLRVNHLIGFGLLVLAVYFLFKRWLS